MGKLVLKMEVVCSSEMLVSTYDPTWQNNQKTTLNKLTHYSTSPSSSCTSAHELKCYHAGKSEIPSGKRGKHKNGNETPHILIYLMTLCPLGPTLKDE
jgi:hypothetical protein